ncbi:MAG: PilZ domain-containing protein [Desulfuromonadales bacterium]
MREKREKARRRKRIKVRFGVDEARKFGFTDDLSEQGFFIRSPHVERPMSHIKVELEIPGEEKIVLKAQVRWAKRIPLQMVQGGKKGGMGVYIDNFISGEESFRNLFAPEIPKATV